MTLPDESWDVITKSREIWNWYVSPQSGLIASNRVKKGYKYLNHFKFTYLIFRHVVCSVVFALETVMDKMPAKPSRIPIGGALHVNIFTFLSTV